MILQMHKLGLAAMLAVIVPAMASAQASLTVEGTEFVLTKAGGGLAKLRPRGRDAEDPRRRQGRRSHDQKRAGRPRSRRRPHRVASFRRQGRKRRTGGHVRAGRGGAQPRLSGARRRRRFRPHLHQRCRRQMHPLGLSALGGAARRPAAWPAASGLRAYGARRLRRRRLPNDARRNHDLLLRPLRHSRLREGCADGIRGRLGKRRRNMRRPAAHPRKHFPGELAERYPKLAPRLGASCTEDGAKSNPAALLFNRSQE